MIDDENNVIEWEGPAAWGWRWAWGLVLAAMVVCSGLLAAAWGRAPWVIPATVGVVVLTAVWGALGVLPLLRLNRACGVRVDFLTRTIVLRNVVVRRGVRTRRHERLELCFADVLWADDLVALRRGGRPMRPAPIFLGTTAGNVSIMSGDLRFCTVVVGALSQTANRSVPSPLVGPTMFTAAGALFGLAVLAAVAVASVTAGEW